MQDNIYTHTAMGKKCTVVTGNMNEAHIFYEKRHKRMSINNRKHIN